MARIKLNDAQARIWWASIEAHLPHIAAGVRLDASDLRIAGIEPTAKALKKLRKWRESVPVLERVVLTADLQARIRKIHDLFETGV